MPETNYNKWHIINRRARQMHKLEKHSYDNYWRRLKDNHGGNITKK